MIVHTGRYQKKKKGNGVKKQTVYWDLNAVNNLMKNLRNGKNRIVRQKARNKPRFYYI